MSTNTYEERRQRAPTLSHRIEFYSMRAAFAGLQKLPWDRACAIGEQLGALGRWPLGIRRHVVERQIAAAFPELSDSQVNQIALGSYKHLGRNAAEAAILPTLGKDGVLGLVDQVDGWEHVEAAMGRGIGGIMVGGHHGNWELMGAYLAARGLKPEVVVRGADNRLFEDYLNANREKLGLTVVHDSKAARSTVKAVKDQRFVAILADQGVLGLASTFVPFFGRPAKTARGFAVFALRLDASVCFMDMLRLPNGRFRVVFEAIEAVKSGDREKDVDAMVARYSEILEKWVRQYPSQYFWQHRRWRRQPEGTPQEQRDPTLKDPGTWTPSR
ncbi:MAG TPA: lysophospholipid acyltransferase family protein [Gemmatimonadaceae bacterium]|nr:lysophospholipid acyltransferase family protein [Gemmatimonadaceae bacterium]